MGFFLNAQDVFDVAIEIERNGALFYRAAAAVVDEEASCRELLELAAMEENHEATFLALKNRLVGSTPDAEWFDPDGDAAQYLQQFAAGQVFDMRASSPPVLTAHMPLRDVIEFAVRRERESVVFYVGLKEAVLDPADKVRIETIVREEMGHITLLGRKLALFVQRT